MLRCRIFRSKMRGMRRETDKEMKEGKTLYGVAGEKNILTFLSSFLYPTPWNLTFHSLYFPDFCLFITPHPPPSCIIKLILSLSPAPTLFLFHWHPFKIWLFAFCIHIHILLSLIPSVPLSPCVSYLLPWQPDNRLYKANKWREQEGWAE